jgi:hypothetical protein
MKGNRRLESWTEVPHLIIDRNLNEMANEYWLVLLINQNFKYGINKGLCFVSLFLNVEYYQFMSDVKLLFNEIAFV